VRELPLHGPKGPQAPNAAANKLQTRVKFGHP
jgi:hypothetical protein